MKLIYHIFIFILLMPFVLAGPGDHAGSDAIFESVGLEIPSEWSSWSRAEKFQYYQNQGW